MAVITVNLDDELIEAADRKARDLSKEYGVPVSRSEIVRRALGSFLMVVRSTDSPRVIEMTSEQLT